jgi:hypothetical protein
MIRSYSELILLPSFNERLEYLKLLDNNVTSPRHMSGNFYRSKVWKTVRKQIIDRDLGFDLGVFGVYIDGGVIVHHINPIDESDIVYRSSRLLDPENLITVSTNTHNLIHYRNEIKEQWIERTPGDTKLW